MSEMPEPASTEGKRPPSNSVIRVQFPPKDRWIFLSRRGKYDMRDPDLFETFLGENTDNAIYWTKSSLQLYLCVKKGAVTWNK